MIFDSHYDVRVMVYLFRGCFGVVLRSILVSNNDSNCNRFKPDLLSWFSGQLLGGFGVILGTFLG